MNKSFNGMNDFGRKSNQESQAQRSMIQKGHEIRSLTIAVLEVYPVHLILWSPSVLKKLYALCHSEPNEVNTS